MGDAELILKKLRFGDVQRKILRDYFAGEDKKGNLSLNQGRNGVTENTTSAGGRELMRRPVESVPLEPHETAACQKKRVCDLASSSLATSILCFLILLFGACVVLLLFALFPTTEPSVVMHNHYAVSQPVVELVKERLVVNNSRDCTKIMDKSTGRVFLECEP